MKDPKRIGLHRFHIHQRKAMVSTVEIEAGVFESIVMYEVEGDELECITSYDLRQAKRTHNRLIYKYNDMIYADSIHKQLGIPNIGQFLEPVVVC